MHVLLGGSKPVVICARGAVVGLVSQHRQHALSAFRSQAWQQPPRQCATRALALPCRLCLPAELCGEGLQSVREF